MNLKIYSTFPQSLFHVGTNTTRCTILTIEEYATDSTLTYTVKAQVWLTI